MVSFAIVIRVLDIVYPALPLENIKNQQAIYEIADKFRISSFNEIKNGDSINFAKSPLE